MKTKILGLVLSGVVLLSSLTPAFARSGDNAPDSANFVLTSPNPDLPSASVLQGGDNVTVNTSGGVTTISAEVPDVSQLKNLTFTITSDPNVVLNEHTLPDLVMFNAALNTINAILPGPSTMTGRVVILKRVDNNPSASVNVTVSGDNLIDFSLSKSLTVTSVLRVFSDGTKYLVLN